MLALAGTKIGHVAIPFRAFVPASLTIFLLLLRPGVSSAAPATTNSEATIDDIAAGIEKHIAEQSKANGGHFKLVYHKKELSLELVRVHLEYLAALRGGISFACVDLVGADGPVYDVDFFMKGPPGGMTVTDTSVHKINGQPIYLWQQRQDGTWGKVPVKNAPKRLLGVIHGSDEFEFTYRVKLPQIAGAARLWLPLAESDTFQRVRVKEIKTPEPWLELEEREHGNKVLFLEERARAIYDHVIGKLRYAKYGSGWGVGDAVHACDVRSGNCSDFHAYFIALAREASIPARFQIGAAIPSERNDGGIDGDHCWAEFFAEGKWVPVDVSEADKNSSLADYYFGHHPANRFELSKGRDLVVEPRPVTGPINFLAYPVMEVDGLLVRVQTEFLFRRPG